MKYAKLTPKVSSAIAAIRRLEEEIEVRTDALKRHRATLVRAAEKAGLKTARESGGRLSRSGIVAFAKRNGSREEVARVSKTRTRTIDTIVLRVRYPAIATECEAAGTRVCVTVFDS